MTIAIRPSSRARDGGACRNDLPDAASEKSATDWHDGQMAQGGYVRRDDTRRTPGGFNTSIVIECFLRNGCY